MNDSEIRMKKRYFRLIVAGLFLMGCHAQESTNGQFMLLKSRQDSFWKIGNLDSKDTPIKSQFNWEVKDGQGRAELRIGSSQDRNGFSFTIDPSLIEKTKEGDDRLKMKIMSTPDSELWVEITRSVTPYDTRSYTSYGSTIIDHSAKVITKVRFIEKLTTPDSPEEDLGIYVGDENKWISREEIKPDPEPRSQYPERWHRGDGIPARPRPKD